MRSHVVVLVVLAACRREEAHPVTTGSASAPAARQPAQQASHLDPLAIELVAKGACDRLRGQFRALPGGGTVWIRDCLQVVGPAKVSFSIGGLAWRDRAAAQFSFETNGRLAVTYDAATKVVDARWDPDVPDSFVVLPVGGNSALASGLDNDVASAIALGLVAPNGALTAIEQPLTPRSGIDVQVPMCTGIPKLTFGTDEQMQTRGDSRATVEVHADTPALFGPLPAAADDVTILAIRGRAQVDLVCAQDAAAVAQAFTKTGKIPAVKSLVTKTVRASTRIEIPSASCPLTLLVRASTKRRTTLSWYMEATSAIDVAPLRCDDQLRSSSVRAP